MNHREAKREAQRMQSNREELVERMARVVPEDGSLEAFDGFFLARSSKPMNRCIPCTSPHSSRADDNSIDEG
jgi:hypothetical protein